MLLPEPAEQVNGNQESIWEEWEEHTFSVDPQERASGLPFTKDTALKEPLGCSSMVNVACDVVIR